MRPKSVAAHSQALAHEFGICELSSAHAVSEVREDSSSGQKPWRWFESCRGAIAAPRPVRSGLAESGAGGVQDHVASELEEVAVRLRQSAVEAVLEDVSVEVVAAVEPLRMPRLSSCIPSEMFG